MPGLLCGDQETARAGEWIADYAPGRYKADHLLCQTHGFFRHVPLREWQTFCEYAQQDSTIEDSMSNDRFWPASDLHQS